MTAKKYSPSKTHEDIINTDKTNNKPKKRPILTRDVNRILLKAKRELLKSEAYNNRLNKKHLAKVRYMLHWLTLIPITKEVLDNWEMPDYNTIMRMKKGEKYGN